jgi:hypothetical protein
MGRRVSHSQDYIYNIADAVASARSKDPDVVLDWEWWKRQAALYNVTPNNIYSRAISRGIYTPPSKRTSGSSEKHRKATAPTTASTESGSAVPLSEPTLPEAQQPPSSRPRTIEIAPAIETAPRQTSSKSPGRDRTASLTTRALTERLKAMAEMTDLIGEMEEKIVELEHEKEIETLRRRESLRALDRLERVMEEAIHTVSALKELFE